MATSFDPNFGSALDAAAAIRGRVISSVELTQHTFRRIDAHQPALNAYVYQMREEALSAAAKADETLARGEQVGPFHGVPVSVKESFGVRGQPCTWGFPMLKDARAGCHSTAVQRLLDSGAILLGATNVPMSLMDCQSFNDLYGQSNNPWDLSRTPGGSSGGTAASLAAGLAFLSIGSDIGGSIRQPASFCGVYGHKPTLDLVPLTGHSPGGMIAPPGFSTLLAVAGPMARTAQDIEAELRVLGGPEPPDAIATSWQLPAPRHKKLSDFRIGFVLEDPLVPVCAETKTVLEQAVKACERAGATVKQGWPQGMQFADIVETYTFLLGAFDFSVTPPEHQATAREALKSRPPAFARGALSTFAEWQAMNIRRLVYRVRWQRYFNDFDVFLSPTAFTAAFPHDTTPIDTRTIPTASGTSQDAWDIVRYITPATLTGCPATTAPAGLTASGLPVGIQVMGPFYEDATPIKFSELLAHEIGGFQPPPGY